ncbi:MAG TPA: hypothetical protein VG838_03110 [Opitutaceae bacterium]|nr:hypothetical protein [Opitutaceae bacterium]
MSQDHSRKHFLAKFIGLIAATGLAPKLLARSADAKAAPAAPSASFQLQPEPRAVARQVGSA